MTVTKREWWKKASDHLMYVLVTIFCALVVYHLVMVLLRDTVTIYETRKAVIIAEIVFISVIGLYAAIRQFWIFKDLREVQ